MELALDIDNVKCSDSLRAQNDFQKHNVYLPKFVNSLKNFLIIFSQIHIN